MLSSSAGSLDAFSNSSALKKPYELKLRAI